MMSTLVAKDSTAVANQLPESPYLLPDVKTCCKVIARESHYNANLWQDIKTCCKAVATCQHLLQDINSCCKDVVKESYIPVLRESTHVAKILQDNSTSCMIVQTFSKESRPAAKLLYDVKRCCRMPTPVAIYQNVMQRCYKRVQSVAR
jgi:hypothetical protein